MSALELLGVRWRSGKIQALVGPDSYGLHVDAGRIIAATSTHRTLRLGHLLLQRGLVEPAFLHRALAANRPIVSPPALGGVLVAEGGVTRGDLAVGIEEQCVEILSRMLELDDATFLFVCDDPIPSGIEVVPLETNQLFAEADRRNDDRAATRAMQRLLPPSDVFLSFTARLSLVSYLLTDAELLVALQVDRGAMSLERLAVALPLDPLTVKRTVIGLMERGYLIAGAQRYPRPD